MLNSYKTYGAMGLGLAGLLVMAGMAPVQAQQNRQGQQNRQARQNRETLSTGTVLAVKLDDPLSSRSAHKGDTFTATVTSTEMDGASSALPTGTRVYGVVRAVEAKDGKNPGMLDLGFTRVKLPNGNSYTITGSPIGLDNKSVTTRDGRLVAKSGRSGPDRLTYVGIGAGAGLLVNVLAHRKGTLMDMLIGAGLGYGAGALIKGKTEVRDVELKSGAKLGVKLDRSVTVSL